MTAVQTTAQQALKLSYDALRTICTVYPTGHLEMTAHEESCLELAVRDLMSARQNLNTLIENEPRSTDN